METWDVRGLEQLALRAAEVARGFDSGSLAARDAARVVELTTRVERAVNGIRLQATAVVASSGTWKGQGHTSEAAWFATATGKPLGEAIGDVAAGKALGELPKVAEAVQSGLLSPAEARAIAGAAAEAPAAQEELLAAAGKGMKSLTEACKRAKAAVDKDPEATRARIDANRCATRHDDSDGTAVLTLRGTPDRIGRMWAHAEHQAKTFFDKARNDGRREPWGAYVFDAIEADICADGAGRSMPTGADAKVIFRVDWQAYQRGGTEAGEVCEQTGVGPVPVSVVRDVVDGDAFIAAVVTEGTDIRLVTHLGRHPKVLQATALQWRSPTCVTEGCERTARLEVDHDIDWSLTELTHVDFLELRCHEHHRLKTRHGWTTEPRADAEDPEQRALVPPEPDGPPPAVRRGNAGVDDGLRAALQDAVAAIEAERRRRAEPA